MRGDLDRALQQAVGSGAAPGIALLVEHRGTVVYRGAVGLRSVTPAREAMTPDDLFDLASLTKVVATTPAVMALVQDGKLVLDRPAATYFPEFAQNGKGRVTLRHLLTHTSGLPAWVDLQKKFGIPPTAGIQDRRAAVTAALAALPLRSAPGTRETYSDLGFLTLEEVVRRVTGEPLDRFVHRRIHGPLGMQRTTYRPGAGERAGAVPTLLLGGRALRGEVHDQNARVLGGVAGHAGLFSTLDDLAVYGRMLLSTDTGDRRRYPLLPTTLRAMSMPQTPPGLPLRGLGWDIASPLAARVCSTRLPLGSFGHTGFTGTFLWVDPYSRTLVVGLSNRLHPHGHGDVRDVWRRVTGILGNWFYPGESSPAVAARSPIEGRSDGARTALDQLRSEGFRRLRGRRIAWIGTREATTSDGIPALELLRRTGGVRLAMVAFPLARGRFALASRGAAPGSASHADVLPNPRGRSAPRTADHPELLVVDLPNSGRAGDPVLPVLAGVLRYAAAQQVPVLVLDRPAAVRRGALTAGPGPHSAGGNSTVVLPDPHGLSLGELTLTLRQQLGLTCTVEVATAP